MKIIRTLVFCGIGIASITAALRGNSTPDNPDIQSIGLALSADRDKARHDRIKTRCTETADELVSAARSAIRRKDAAAAVSMLAPCMDIPESPGTIRTTHAAAQAALEKERKTAIAEDKKRRKSMGVSIGMTQAEVLDSSWGKPKHINRTTTPLRSREQWVYGNGNYLYFEDGTLTSIQN